VAQARGVESYLIDSPVDIDPAWLDGKRCVGISSGASAPEDVVQAVLAWLRQAGVQQVEEVDAPDEKVVFTVPRLTAPGSAAAPAQVDARLENGELMIKNGRPRSTSTGAPGGDTGG
jgi:hypothetical protein